MRTSGSPKELELRRRIAGEFLLQGMGVCEVAAVVEASTSAVSRWKQIVQRDGLDGLRAKPHPGPTPRLSVQQKQQLVALLREGPLAAGYPNEMWTCTRVAELIECHFGVSYHEDHVWRILDHLGWSCQKPEQKARERDEAAIARWRRRDWPRIKKGHATTS
jgi:transposase